MINISQIGKQLSGYPILYDYCITFLNPLIAIKEDVQCIVHSRYYSLNQLFRKGSLFVNFRGIWTLIVKCMYT